MKPYKFLAASNQRVFISDDEISFSPRVGDLSLRRQHWPKVEIIGVSVGPSGARRRRSEVSVTRSDGTMRRLRDVQADAAEVASAFQVRGYPVHSSSS